MLWRLKYSVKLHRDVLAWKINIFHFFFQVFLDVGDFRMNMFFLTTKRKNLPFFFVFALFFRFFFLVWTGSKVSTLGKFGASLPYVAGVHSYCRKSTMTRLHYYY